MKRMILTLMAAALVSMTALAQEEKQGHSALSRSSTRLRW